MTEKETQFQWTEECQRAFDSIKQLLIIQPVLHMLMAIDKLRFRNYKSKIAASSLLFQFQQGYSYLLDTTQRNCCKQKKTIESRTRIDRPS